MGLHLRRFVHGACTVSIVHAPHPRRAHCEQHRADTGNVCATFRKNKTILILMHDVAQQVGTVQRLTAPRYAVQVELGTILPPIFFCRFPIENDNGGPVSKGGFGVGGGRKSRVSKCIVTYCSKKGWCFFLNFSGPKRSFLDQNPRFIIFFKVGLHLRLLVRGACAVSTMHTPYTTVHRTSCTRRASCSLRVRSLCGAARSASATCTTFIESKEKTLGHQYLQNSPKVLKKLISRSLDDGQLQCRDLQCYGWNSFVSRSISPGKTIFSYTTRSSSSSSCSYHSFSKEEHIVKKKWLLRRPYRGNYENLLQELHREDRKGYKNFMRISAELFNEMVERLSSILKNEETRMRKPLPVGLKLAVTLRFLATGNSYSDLQYSFRVSKSTISIFIPQEKSVGPSPSFSSRKYLFALDPQTNGRM